jgi:hypothetical protein
MTRAALEAISKAVSLIKKGELKRADLGHGMVAYRVPSNNPDKYIIRVDIKVREGKPNET